MRWREDKTENLARELHAGRLDAALLALEADLGGPLQREVIGRDRFVLATPRAHPLAKQTRPATLGDLRGAPLLLLDDGHCLRDQALAVCAGARTEELAFRATSLPTLAQMVSAGAGITLLPHLAVATENRRAHLAVRPLADERAFRTLALVWRPSSPAGPALRKLAATIRDSYEKIETLLPAARGEGTKTVKGTASMTFWNSASACAGAQTCFETCSPTMRRPRPAHSTVCFSSSLPGRRSRPPRSRWRRAARSSSTSRQQSDPGPSARARPPESPGG